MTRRCTIENPVINAPFAVPERHFRFTETSISHEIVAGRRHSPQFPKGSGCRR
jgi:hypothetical protein